MSTYEVACTPLRIGEKQTRVADRKRRVRVIDSFGRLLVVIVEPKVIATCLSAPNALPVRDHHGRLCAIQLASLADDRGEPGEHHGDSRINTERCRNDSGEYIGPHIRLKHKDDRSEDR
jgi:hypothetical protein